MTDSSIRYNLHHLFLLTINRIFKVADNFISEQIEKEITQILEKNHSIVNFTLRGNRISKACLKRVKQILTRNRKKEEDREPNNLKTQIYRL